jgi:methyltransferase (TIGR00027 family)
MRPGRPSLTARWVAAQRAGLSGSRPSTPTGNPEAERRLYAGMGRMFALSALRPPGIAVRTNFFDAEVARAIGAKVEQIVIVGAGYDGRALRFGGGATQWIEVDYPATQADKRERLSAAGVLDTAAVRYVGVDLMTDDLDGALCSAGHDPERPSLFMCEGLFPYLTLEVGASLCTTLHSRAAPGSVLASNFPVTPQAGVAGQALRNLVDLALSGVGERRLMDFRPGDPEKLLTVTGWREVRRAVSSPSRIDSGSYRLAMAAEPA